MKSRIHVRKIDRKYPEEATVVELEIDGQKVVGKRVLRAGAWDLENFPELDSSVRGRLGPWLQGAVSEAKLPNEDEDTYRRIENLMQLGDLLGLGREE